MPLGAARGLLSAPARSGAFRPSGQALLRAGKSRLAPRCAISKPSGAIMPAPFTMPFGLLRVLCVVTTFLSFGMYLSKTLAAYLEGFNALQPAFEEDDV